MPKASTSSLKERFEQKAFPDPNTGCWLWGGSQQTDGYGNIFYSKQKGVRLAHRVSYELYVKSIPKGLQVLHKCDVTFCVNPEHLFLGTQLENIKDRVNKNRSSHLSGQLSPRALFTDNQIREIRKTAFNKKLTVNETAELFKRPIETIRAILKRTKWNHVL